MAASPGDVLDGRFRLTEQIGRGGMSTVYRAEDLARDGQAVVIKIAIPMFSSGIGAWSIFEREQEIGARLDHPYVLRFLPGEAHGRRRPYVVTELVPGQTLAAHLALRRPLPEPEALHIGAQICEAVAHVHARGYVHYDIKPANVMVCPDGTIRLIDLGLAHAAVDGRFAFAGRPPAIGSFDYVAPEQIRRQRGRRSVDIYGVGAILYEMLTGHAPFPGDDPFVVASARVLGDPPAPSASNPRISPEAEEIVLRALRREPSERYPSAAAMKAALDHPELVLVTGLCDRLEPVTRARRILRRARHILLVAVIPVLAQVALFLLLWQHFARRG
jgi:serine/threonine protein kinase